MQLTKFVLATAGILCLPLVVIASCVDAVQNGGFESSVYPPWIIGNGNLALGATGVVHTGDASALLGLATPYNGDNELTQTIFVEGPRRLTFWYNAHCSGTRATDWVQAQVRAQDGTILLTPLDTCENTGTWTRVTADLTPFANTYVTLYFNAHDDGQPDTPTYMYLDDVSATTSIPPAVVITNPGDAPVAGIQGIIVNMTTAACTVAAGIEIYVDGVLLGSNGPADSTTESLIVRWDTTGLEPVSIHRITAKGYDKAGNVTTVEKDVLIGGLIGSVVFRNTTKTLDPVLALDVPWGNTTLDILFLFVDQYLKAINVRPGTPDYLKEVASVAFGGPSVGVTYARLKNTASGSVFVAAGSRVQRFDLSSTSGFVLKSTSPDLGRGAICTADTISPPVVQWYTQSSPAFQATVGDDLVFVATRHECRDETTNQVIALYGSTVTRAWTFNLAGSYPVAPSYSPCALDYARDRLYCGVALSSQHPQGTLFALSSTDGSLQWSLNVGSLRTSPVLYQGNVSDVDGKRSLYLANASGVLMNMDPDSGALRSSLAVAKAVSVNRLNSLAVNFDPLFDRWISVLASDGTIYHAVDDWRPAQTGGALRAHSTFGVKGRAKASTVTPIDPGSARFFLTQTDNTAHQAIAINDVDETTILNLGTSDGSAGMTPVMYASPGASKNDMLFLVSDGGQDGSGVSLKVYTLPLLRGFF